MTPRHLIWRVSNAQDQCYVQLLSVVLTWICQIFLSSGSAYTQKKAAKRSFQVESCSVYVSLSHLHIKFRVPVLLTSFVIVPLQVQQDQYTPQNHMMSDAICKLKSMLVVKLPQQRQLGLQTLVCLTEYTWQGILSVCLGYCMTYYVYYCQQMLDWWNMWRHS